MAVVRTAVIGVGHFGRFHAEKYAASENADLVAVVDADATRAGEVASKHGAQALTDYRALIGLVDAVSIAVPTIAHYEIARFFLDHGVHVLVEKPFTSTIAEADDLILRARSANLVLQIGHLERFFCADSGLFDQVTAPLFIEALRIAPFKPRGADVSVIFDLMIHDIDLIASLVDAPIVSVDAVGTPVLSDHEDIVNARIAFENGCVATITASRIAFKSERKLRVFQPDCMLVANLLERRMTCVRKITTEDGPRLDVDEWEVGAQDPLRTEISSFLQAVASGGEPVVTGEDGREALIIAERIVESLRAQRAIVDHHMIQPAFGDSGLTMDDLPLTGHTGTRS
ncbi:Gfo/Idh/MocA family protein [Thalassococcus sp. S3]|uniref:Gfo/Idh/MocA family protein n=1 Tax=Thalassococcus sp. S3 TaxID=2017482 RepID=UPI001C2C68DE|nr:Gfo/Idh/MocA family oxidoreductase [Thalassococcus sp. S3]